MSKYLVYDVLALEDLKFSKTNVQSDSEATLEYIPGTSIRGAYIYKYIVENRVKDINSGIHREKLLKGRIKFLNAYPKHNKDRSIPFPKIYFAPKEDLKSFKEPLKIQSGIHTILDSGYEKVRLSEFTGLENGEYINIDIEKGENLHINKMKGERDNKLFRYEFIKKGQIFQGIIKVEEDEDIDEVKRLFQDSIVYLGGSKGSGYGKCNILKMKVVADNPENAFLQKQGDFGDEIYLIALSDIIFRNEIGEYKTFIPEEFILKELEIQDAKLIDSSIETKNITNFNNKWNCSTPNINAIKKGSAFKYKIKGEIKSSLLNEFIDRGIGERKLDGFGRFNIVRDIEDSYIRSSKACEDIEDLNNDNNLSKLNSQEKLQLQKIIDSIYKKRLENNISKRVIEIDEKIQNRNMMKNNQWGNLKDLFTSLIYEEFEIGIKRYNDYMEHIKDKRSISFKQLKRVKVSDRNLIDFLDKFVKNILDIEELEKHSKIEKIVLGELQSNLDHQFIYSYNMKLLRELCRFEIRMGERQ